MTITTVHLRETGQDGDSGGPLRSVLMGTQDRSQARLLGSVLHPHRGGCAAVPGNDPNLEVAIATSSDQSGCAAATAADWQLAQMPCTVSGDQPSDRHGMAWHANRIPIPLSALKMHPRGRACMHCTALTEEERPQAEAQHRRHHEPQVEGHCHQHQQVL